MRQIKRKKKEKFLAGSAKLNCQEINGKVCWANKNVAWILLSLMEKFCQKIIQSSRNKKNLIFDFIKN